MEFLPAVPDDLEAVMEVFKKGVENLIKIGIDQWDDVYPNERIISKDIKYGNLYKVVLNGKPMGAVVINTMEDPEYWDIPWQYENPCVLHRLCVHPEALGLGIGRFAVSMAEKEAGKRGFSSMRLDTFSKNPFSNGVYRGLGYEYRGDVTFRKGSFHCYEKKLSAE